MNPIYPVALYDIHLPLKSTRLLDSDRLGQVTREVDVEALEDSQPVGDQLERNDVEDALQDVDGLGDLDPLAVGVLELLVVLVADDDWPATTSSD